MRRTAATLLAAGAMVLGPGLVAGTAPAQATGGPIPQAAASAAAQSADAGSAKQWTMQRRFAREVVRFKDWDRDPRHIEHVTDLQYRLRWVGAYKGPISGFFFTKVRGAVKRFQKRVHIRANGVANHKTWAALIPRTIKARGLLPWRCKHGIGWHLCYDRYRHQVTLWKRGVLRNSWLVRGGDRGYETRTGNFRVYLRDRDHVSGIYGTPMPFSQFFSGGQAFHGSPFMMDPWQDHSHGCVNMYIEDARQLWSMTHDVNLNVHVYGAWNRTAGPDVGTRGLRLLG